MPEFQDRASIPPKVAILQVISSIAMEELALSHILNSEGEKLQYVLGTLSSGSLAHAPTIAQLSEINASVKSAVSAVNMSQLFLMGKLSQAVGAYQYLANIATITIMYINSVDGSEIANAKVIQMQPGSYSVTPPVFEDFSPGNLAPGSAPYSGTISKGESIVVIFEYDPYAYLDVSFTYSFSPPFVLIQPDMHLRIPPHIPFTFDPPQNFYIDSIHYSYIQVIDGSIPNSLTIQDPLPGQHYFLVLLYISEG
ncbi:MAG: hypothetical protein FWG10_02300 [Eubacteriaceae bacterium]|nr:hypothetical protein [Eubacteriaceae bacterium]